MKTAPTTMVPPCWVCDHTSYSDAMALLATTGRPVVFVVTREVYERRSLRWVLQAENCIPVRRDTVDIVATRRMLKTLPSGEVLGISGLEFTFNRESAGGESAVVWLPSGPAAIG